MLSDFFILYHISLFHITLAKSSVLSGHQLAAKEVKEYFILSEFV